MLTQALFWIERGSSRKTGSGAVFASTQQAARPAAALDELCIQQRDELNARYEFAHQSFVVGQE